MNGFHGEALSLPVEEIPALAYKFDLEGAVLRAVMAVESAGNGYDASGRPKALFERHHFHKWLLKRKKLDVLAVATEANLAYPKWGMKPYPKGSDAVYAEIEAAYEMAPEEALLSTSWGLGQVMGSNYAMVGCKTVDDMVEEAMHSEANQLTHMINFIKSANLLDALRSKDWATFAKGYNGPGYATNHYDTKLETAYQRFKI